MCLKGPGSYGEKGIVFYMKIMSDVYWNCGRRPCNEDSVTVQQVVTSRGRVLLAAVSDGIGGLPEGQNASGYILEQLVQNFYKELIPLVARKKTKQVITKSLLRCFYEMNENLNCYARGRNIKLGATISLLFVWKRQYMIFHLGDSRIYQCRRGKLKLLTKDHSDGHSGLTKCMGSFPCQKPDIYGGRIWGKKGFLLCTDGFYGTLSMDETGEVLNPGEITLEEQIEKRLDGLGELAIKNGGRDNLSAIYTIIH